MNICTHFDKNYFYKGLALYKSLTETIEGEFLLHILCNGDELFKTLKILSLPNIKLYSLKEIEDKDLELSAARDNPPCKYGDQYSQFTWTLTPYFVNHILKSLPEGEKLIYADSDIFFYRSPQTILDIVNKSVGIHTHRFAGAFRNTETGWYNVGVTIFTNNDKGREISDKWKGWLLNPNNEYYNTHGMCGDQKYLDLFPELWHADICVFDDARCNHIAPWNTDVKNPVTFFHFSHFNIDIPTGKWRDSNNGEWNPARSPVIKAYYEDYAMTIMGLHDKFLQ
jgi:lipopolysaccharide biosynthesis glycosyltransferase